MNLILRERTPTSAPPEIRSSLCDHRDGPARGANILRRREPTTHDETFR